MSYVEDPNAKVPPVRFDDGLNISKEELKQALEKAVKKLEQLRAQKARGDGAEAVTDSADVGLSPELQKSLAMIREMCRSMEELLLQKHRAYGDSAFNPVRIFSKASPVEQIRVRIDDKLSRIRQRGTSSDESQEDTIRDLIGYLYLLQIAERREREERDQAWSDFKKSEPNGNGDVLPKVSIIPTIWPPDMTDLLKELRDQSLTVKMAQPGATATTIVDTSTDQAGDKYERRA